jgi:hypothetical protein
MNVVSKATKKSEPYFLSLTENNGGFLFIKKTTTSLLFKILLKKTLTFHSLSSLESVCILILIFERLF